MGKSWVKQKYKSVHWVKKQQISQKTMGKTEKTQEKHKKNNGNPHQNREKTIPDHT